MKHTVCCCNISFCVALLCKGCKYSCWIIWFHFKSHFKFKYGIVDKTLQFIISEYFFWSDPGFCKLIRVITQTYHQSLDVVSLLTSSVDLTPSHSPGSHLTFQTPRASHSQTKIPEINQQPWHPRKRQRRKPKSLARNMNDWTLRFRFPACTAVVDAYAILRMISKPQCVLLFSGIDRDDVSCMWMFVLTVQAFYELWRP